MEFLGISIGLLVSHATAAIAGAIFLPPILRAVRNRLADWVRNMTEGL